MSSLFCLRKPDNASQIESNRQIPRRKPNAVIQLLRRGELHPVKRTEKKYKVFPAGSQLLLAAFYAAKDSRCVSGGVRIPESNPIRTEENRLNASVRRFHWLLTCL